MSEKLQFLPADFTIHRSQLAELNVEYMNWWLKGIEGIFKTDLATTRMVKRSRRKEEARILNC